MRSTLVFGATSSSACSVSKGETTPECIVISTAGPHYVQYAGLGQQGRARGGAPALRRRDREHAAQFAALNAIQPRQPLYCQNCDARLKAAAVRCHYCGSEDLAVGVPPSAGVPVPGAMRQIIGLAIASMVLGGCRDPPDPCFWLRGGLRIAGDHPRAYGPLEAPRGR